jgi:sugar lactone lactonase YvrE
MRFLLVALAFVSLAAAETALPSPESSVGLAWDFSGQPIPRFKNGFLIGYDSDHATVRSFDSGGKLVTQTKLVLPEAAVVSINDVAAWTDGRLVVSASIKSVNGALASAFIYLNAGGTVTRIVRTTPFAAFRIAVSTDGTLWAVGRVHNNNFEDEPSHDVLHHFDANGVFLGSLLASDTFASGKNRPATGHW